MSRILYLHGSAEISFGDKTEHLQRHGHEVVGRPRLDYPQHPRRSWRWLLAYFNQTWLRNALKAAQEAFDACRPEVVVGASMGGAVAMNLASGATPQVLVVPAWKAWHVLHFGLARRVKPATVVLHGEEDRTVFPRYSRELLETSRPDAQGAALVAVLEEKLRERLGGAPDEYGIEGRLIVVRGEEHRCSSEPALRALLAAVEVVAE
jgi:pimeloyl-ACP methyl ester carboxylesterase